MANDRFAINVAAPRGQELKNILNQLANVRNWLRAQKASLPHYGSAATGDTGAAAIVSDFGLGNIDGKAFQDLITGCANDVDGTTAGTSVPGLMDRGG